MWAERLEDCQDPADWAYCTCAVYSCGYSQPNREHISEEWLREGTAETDCSYGVNWWLWKGGYVDDCIGFATRDGTELAYLEEQGFEFLDPSETEPQRNDVLWLEGHTALYIGDGMQAEAIRTENHDAGWNGSMEGDQDGGETVVRPYPSWTDWQLIMRPPRGPEPQPEPEPDDTEERMGFMGLAYIIDVTGDHRIVEGDERTALLHKGWQVLWTQEGGFKYLESTDSVKAIEENAMYFTGKPLPHKESRKGLPWAYRLYQATAINAQNTVLTKYWPEQ